MSIDMGNGAQIKILEMGDGTVISIKIVLYYKTMANIIDCDLTAYPMKIDEIWYYKITKRHS